MKDAGKTYGFPFILHPSAFLSHPLAHARGSEFAPPPANTLFSSRRAVL
jgi:hypothetical protein